jgi:hypothetical protein
LPGQKSVQDRPTRTLSTRNAFSGRFSPLDGQFINCDLLSLLALAVQSDPLSQGPTFRTERVRFGVEKRGVRFGRYVSILVRSDNIRLKKEIGPFLLLLIRPEFDVIEAVVTRAVSPFLASDDVCRTAKFTARQLLNISLAVRTNLSPFQTQPRLVIIMTCPI